MFKIGDKLTKENYTAGAIWCNANNCTIDSDWIIKAVPEPLPPTKEEQQKARAEAYRLEKDPITCQINSLRDEEQTPEIVAEIAQLVEERKAKVEEIKQRFPYPEETLTEPSSSNIIETSETDINSILGEKQNG